MNTNRTETAARMRRLKAAVVAVVAIAGLTVASADAAQARTLNQHQSLRVANNHGTNQATTHRSMT